MVAAAHGVQLCKQVGVLKANLARERVFDDDFQKRLRGLRDDLKARFEVA